MAATPRRGTVGRFLARFKDNSQQNGRLNGGVSLIGIFARIFQVAQS
jgi:hypothetical protein